MFGFAAEEALGQSPIVPVHLQAAHWTGFDAAMKNDALKLEGRPTLTRGQHKSGRKLYVEMTFALVMDAGAAEGAVAVARDVTDRVVREREAASATPASQEIGRDDRPRHSAEPRDWPSAREDLSGLCEPYPSRSFLIDIQPFVILDCRIEGDPDDDWIKR